MNVVIVSSSPAVIAATREATRHELWTVVAHWSTRDDVTLALQELAPGSKATPHWDELLAIDGIDAAVACGDGKENVEAARQLSARGLPLLVVIDTTAAPATQFALSPVWHDHRSEVTPILGTGLLRQALVALDRFGATHAVLPTRIEFTRTVPASESRDGFSEDDIDRHFFHAATVLRRLGGEFQEITSLRSGVRGETSQQALITLAGEGAADVSWTLDRGQQSECRITVHGPKREVASSQWNPEERVGEDLVGELRGVVRRDGPTWGFQWPDLIRAGELAAAARTSATRRRTIRMQLEEGTERAQFKSQMTALGCGVLMWAMFGSMLMLFCAVVFDPRDREYKTAAAHDFVLRNWEFAEDSNQLNPAGQEHVAEIARRWRESETAVLVEVRGNLAEAAAAARRKDVVGRLESTGLRETGTRVVARRLSGQFYEAMLRLGWLVVFIPLVLFLVVQGLIIAARGPAQSQQLP